MRGDRLIARLNFSGETKKIARFIFIADVNVHECRIALRELIWLKEERSF
jgi:hypothetical protein